MPLSLKPSPISTETFPDPTLVERLKILAGDPQTDPKVKKILMSTLKGFHQQFNDDRSMKVYANWWDEVGGARGVSERILIYHEFWTLNALFGGL